MTIQSCIINMGRRDAFVQACQPLHAEMRRIDAIYRERLDKLQAACRKAEDDLNTWMNTSNVDWEITRKQFQAAVEKLRRQYFPEEYNPGYDAF